MADRRSEFRWLPTHCMACQRKLDRKHLAYCGRCLAILGVMMYGAPDTLPAQPEDEDRQK